MRTSILPFLWVAFAAACGGGGATHHHDAGQPPGSTDEGTTPHDGGLTPPDASDNGPTILSFGTNVTALTQSQAVEFVAVLTHPGGLDELVGGRLTDPTGAINYGAFVATTQGSYQLSLSWESINQAGDISFTTGEDRQFLAEFFDVGGNHSTRLTTLHLFCATDHVACSGHCVNLADDGDNCGKCGRSAAVRVGFPAECVDGLPNCWAADATYCVGAETCKSLATEFNCGACGNACTGTDVCFKALKCLPVYPLEDPQFTCDDICSDQGLTCVGGRSSGSYYPCDHIYFVAGASCFCE